MYKPKTVHAASEQNILQQVEKFKHIGQGWYSERTGRWSKEVDA